jgi:cytosine/adenosine deaminase-related metal-dependent hydrolase
MDRESEAALPRAGKEQQRRALWVFPVSQAPVRDGVISSVAALDSSVATLDLSSDSFASSRRQRQTREVVTEVTTQIGPLPTTVTDHGNVALIPGLINPHTHLEFSDLREPVGIADSAFPDWIREVIRTRREIPESDRADRKNAAIARGVHECVADGVAAIGEIATNPTDTSVYAVPGLQVVAFRELISNDPTMVPELLSQLATHRTQCLHDDVIPGVSPHAPYTVSVELLVAACQWSLESNAPLAFHFAESPEERELLESGEGPFAQLLREAGAWRAEQFGNRPPIDYLKPLAICPRVALIHGNFLGPEERQFVAQRPDKMTVVYCPRTHEYFGHSPYPLSEYLEQGISMAIGTDSRASNPNLSSMQELLATRRRHPDIDPSRLLEMATIRAAEAIGIASEFGSIEAGKPLNYLKIPVDPSIADPYDALFDGISRQANSDF